VVVDKPTKYAHICGIQSTYTASQVAEVFTKEIHRLHGFPKVIVSDKYPKFTRNYWKELWNMNGTTQGISSVCHPQANDQTKIVNKCSEGYLCCYSSNKQSQWVKWIPLAK